MLTLTSKGKVEYVHYIAYSTELHLHESSNPGFNSFLVTTEFQSTNGCGFESIQVTIRVGGVHTGGKSGLNPGF